MTSTDAEITEIKGFIPTTMLDWEGKLASSLFVGGCNFRCPFCHNPDLVLNPEKLPSISQHFLENFLRNRRNWIDGVVIGGGEPCANSQLFQVCVFLKRLGYPVKLDTNGSFPKILEKLLKEKLVDSVAMDVKGSFNKYREVAGIEIEPEKIKESINLTLSFRVEHEFRTTVVPGLVTREDVLEIAKYLSDCGAQHYVLQQFKPGQVLDQKVTTIKPYDKGVLKEWAIECSGFLPTKVR